MIQEYVTHVHRQHTSVVTTIPRAVCKALDLGPGQYLVWQVVKDSLFVQISKVAVGGRNRGKDNVGSNRENQGRRTRAKDGG